MLEHNMGYTATLLLDGRVLVVGGGLGTSADASAELYDPTTGRWTATGAMPEGRINHTATLLSGGRVLVAGGANGVVDPIPSASAQLYDSGSGSWTAAASMIEARGGTTATLLLDGRVLVAGGVSSTVSATAELYDPGGGS
jgi:N-acetylneuraminic acid mutarotase